MRLFVSKKTVFLPISSMKSGVLVCILDGDAVIFLARLGRYYMILGGQSAVLNSKFIRSGGKVKHIKASP